MKHWNETEAILARLTELLSLGRTGALATVVRISGSAYRRPGAKFLIEDDGQTIGGVSGGCLEADVREIARTVTRTLTPRLRHYDTGTDDGVVWGLGLGCNGSVDVFIQPIEAIAGDLQAALAERLRGDQHFAMATIVDGPDTGRSLVLPPFEVRPPARDEARRGAIQAICTAAAPHFDSCESGLDTVSARRIFTEILVPPPHLVVCGAGDDARPVVAYAADAGFQVTVVDHRPAYLTRERFPAARRLLSLRPDAVEETFARSVRTSVVLMTHSLALDREWLRRLLPTPAVYIGLLGPRARTDEILCQIGARHDPRIFGPVGLDIGADGPEQIAISIVAEVLAAHARREPRHLREREVPIHAAEA